MIPLITDMEEKVGNEVDKNLKLIAKSSVIVLVCLLFSKIFMYAYRIIIARYYNAEVYGIFSIAIMVIGFFAVFTMAGLPNGLLRYIPYYRGKDKTNEIKFITKKSIFVIFLSGIFFGSILYIFSGIISINLFHSPELVKYLKLFAISLPFYVLLDTLLVVLLAYEKIGWRSFIFNILQNGVRVIALTLLIFMGLTTNAVAISYILGTVIAAVIAYIVVRFSIKEIFKEFSLTKKERKSVFKELFSYSWPLMFFGLIFSIFHWTDSLILGILTNVQQVGFYNAAVPIAMFLGLTPQLFMQLFFPLITKNYSKNKGNLETITQLSKQVGKWIFIINFPILILMLIFPGAFINLFFGSEYLAAENALKFLAIGAIINSVFIVSNNLLTMIGKSKLLLIDILITSIINVILNVVLIQEYGIAGAAISTTISLIILNVLFMLQAKKHLSIIPLRRKMVSIGLITLVPTAILLYIREKISSTDPLTLAILIILFVSIYLALIVLSNNFDENDKLILRSFFRKAKMRK